MNHLKFALRQLVKSPELTFIGVLVFGSVAVAAVLFAVSRAIAVDPMLPLDCQ